MAIRIVKSDKPKVEAPNTNIALLTDPKLAAMADYVKAAGVYKCPSDRYQSAANPGPRTRSVSMNGTLNNKPQFINQTGRKYFTAKKLADLNTPGPANIFVFLDEHADSIDDGIFMVNPGSALSNKPSIGLIPNGNRRYSPDKQWNFPLTSS